MYVVIRLTQSEATIPTIDQMQSPRPSIAPYPKKQLRKRTKVATCWPHAGHVENHPMCQGNRISTTNSKHPLQTQQYASFGDARSQRHTDPALPVWAGITSKGKRDSASFVLSRHRT